MASNHKLATTMIESAEALEALVLEIGFLPLVPCGIDGFSVKACTPPGRWFAPDVSGPWEWRETVAERGVVAYGRLLGHKAGFVSPQWFSALANWRRRGMDFDERYAAGQVSRLEKQIMDHIRKEGPTSTRALRTIFGKKGLDRAVGMLQMRTDLLVRAVEYRRDAFGRPYGMGAIVLAPAEEIVGEAVVFAEFEDEPTSSYERLCAQVLNVAPDAEGAHVKRMLF